MKTILENMAKEKLVGWFLVLWGLSFLLGGLAYIHLQFFISTETYNVVVGDVGILLNFLGSLAGIAAGLVLVALGYKLLK